MQNAAINARAANVSARYCRDAGAGSTPLIRGVSLDEEDLVGCVDKINCTYPIDFNPWMLYMGFRISRPYPRKKMEPTSTPLGSS